LWLLGAGLIVVIDRVLHESAQPLPLQALLDETGHALTALLILSALGVAPRSPFWWAALAGSVLIDLDHLPGMLGWNGLTYGEPRPYTHSLVTIALLVAWAGCSRGTRRSVLAGLAAGVALHLVRDLATGGVPLFWPIRTIGVQAPYGYYLIALLGAAAGGFALDVMVARARRSCSSLAHEVSRRAG
jgi:inner membrane protein